MGLIDGLLAAALNGGNNNNNSGSGIQGALLSAVIGMITKQSGNSGGVGGLLGGLLGGGQQQQSGGLAGMLGGLLGGAGQQDNNSTANGLSSITGMLSQLGLGDQVNSWIGTGENKPISAQDIQSSLGTNGTLAELASSAGVSETEAAGGLAELLPELVNTLTPNGKIDGGDISSILSGLLNSK